MKVSIDDNRQNLNGVEIRLLNNDGIIVLKAYELSDGLYFSYSPELIHLLDE